MTRDERIHADGWNEAIETAIHLVKKRHPEAADIIEILEACLLEGGEDAA